MTVQQNYSHAKHAAQYLQQKKYPHGGVCKRHVPLRCQSGKPCNAAAIVVGKAVPCPMAEDAYQQRQQMCTRVAGSSLYNAHGACYTVAKNKRIGQQRCADPAQAPLPYQAKADRDEQLHPQRFLRHCMRPKSEVILHIRSNAACDHGNARQVPGKALQVEYGGRMSSGKWHAEIQPANYRAAAMNRKAAQGIYWVR